MPNLLAAHGATASFVWGLCKALVPLPSPSGFILLAAENSRPAAGAGEAAARLLTRVVLPGSAGVALGSAPYYLLARRGGRAAIEGFGHWLGITRRHIQEFERAADRRRGTWVWVMFALPLSPTLLAAVAAGLFEVGTGGYAVLALTGAAVRCSILCSIGWMFRDSFGDPVRFVRPWEVAGAAAVALVAAAWILRRRAVSRRAR